MPSILGLFTNLISILLSIFRSGLLTTNLFDTFSHTEPIAFSTSTEVDTRVTQNKEDDLQTSHPKSHTRKLISNLSKVDHNDPSNPVINGASSSTNSTLKDAIAVLKSQSNRLEDDLKLCKSLIKSEFLEGGIVDDREYVMEQVIRLASSLPKGTILNNLSHAFIKVLWNDLQHPPISILGNDHQYRTADGSYNNIKYPSLGRAGSQYARTVTPKTLKLGVPPDPALIFDSIFARGDAPIEHPNKISSMLFYLASIIIHDVFYTDDRDRSKVRTSSYLDLAPLYGSNQAEQDKIRTFRNGLIKKDTFSEIRLLGFPPGVAALAVCFSRFHNYVAIQLKEINEGGRFSSTEDETAMKKLDEDLFQTARLITCGLYVNIILTDYVRTILNLNHTKSTWTLDPRESFEDIFDPVGVPSGIGNQVSCEFNLVYRWHSAISKKDEKWSAALYREILGRDDFHKVPEQELLTAIRKWLMSHGSEPEMWPLDNGKYMRTANGAFRDEDLINILSDATEDVACAFGPRQVPVVMKVFETLGMTQARSWNVATLNEFRKFFKLEPHKTFRDISSNPEVADALETLYSHPDYVELYPGLVAEDAKQPMEPGSGLCPGYTISRTILSDAVALVRGDRFYTIDYSPATLTNWGFNQIKSDPEVAQGGCFYNLVMRSLPNFYRGNSVYALFPFTVPDETYKILTKLGTSDEYSFDRPSFIGLPAPVKTWEGCSSVLRDQRRFRVPWGEHTFYLTGHDYMLSGDKSHNAELKREMEQQMYCPVNGLDKIRTFYEALTTQLIEANSRILRGRKFQLDACRDVSNSSHAIFVAQLFHIPLKQPGGLLPAATVDELYLALSVLFAYVFLDADTARSFKLRQGAKSAGDQLAKLVELICGAVKVGDHIGLKEQLGSLNSCQILRSYGLQLIERMFEGNKSVQEVVWNIIPTAAAAVATQAQQFTQILDLYMSDEYKSHWPEIQRCALSDTNEDFEKLKSYALEACRIAPAAYGLLRRSAGDTTIHDADRMINVKEGQMIYTDFVSAGLDPTVFPSPHEIKLDRPRDRYIHHGLGPHACLGRRMVEVAMAAQLKVFAKLKNLTRAPGMAGEMKRCVVKCPNPVSSEPKESPGSITVFMKEDWSDWWPFPTTMKVHHDGWLDEQRQEVDDLMQIETGLPGREEMMEAARERRNKITQQLRLVPDFIDERKRGRTVGTMTTDTRYLWRKTHDTPLREEFVQTLRRRDSW